MMGSGADDRKDPATAAPTDAPDGLRGNAIGSFLPPGEFFEAFTSRPDVDRIMTALAQIDRDERLEHEQVDHGTVRRARARRWAKTRS